MNASKTMNREIKFRVFSSEVRRFEHFPLNNITISDRLLSQHSYPVQQFTGLKDRNNKEIYEGDILRGKLTEEMAAEGDGAIIGKVFFAAGAFMIDGDGPLYYQTYSLSPDLLMDHEVIGNIFENPELCAN